MKKNWFMMIVLMGALVSCGAVDMNKVIQENGALLDKCIASAKKAQTDIEAAAAAADVATTLNKATDEIKGFIAQGQEISKKYNLNQDQENKVLEALSAKVEEFTTAGRDLGVKVGEAIVKFQDDTAGVDQINAAIENFKTIGE